MPDWIHDRAQHLMSKNPEMSESTAWAVATQQAHAAGKSPKGYGTEEGRKKAKKKYEKKPSEYQQKAAADRIYAQRAMTSLCRNAACFHQLDQVWRLLE